MVLFLEVGGGGVLRNHLMNLVNFLDLSFYGYDHLMVSKSSSSFVVTPLPPTTRPPGIKKKTHKNEPNLYFLRNHLTNRDDFLNLSFYAYKLSLSLEVAPLPPTPSPPGLKKTPKNELHFLRNHLINRVDFLNLCFYAYKITFSLEVTFFRGFLSPVGLGGWGRGLTLKP